MKKIFVFCLILTGVCSLSFSQEATRAKDYYATITYRSKKNTSIIYITKTPDQTTCKNLLSMKAKSETPVWELADQTCQADISLTDAVAFTKQPISEPYAWFIDAYGYPTIAKVAGFSELLAPMMLEQIASQLRSAKLKVDVIKAKNK